MDNEAIGTYSKLLMYQPNVLMAMVQIGCQTCQPNAYCLPNIQEFRYLCQYL